jgi:hypothetical protein
VTEDAKKGQDSRQFIEVYSRSRYVSASEAAWHFLSFILQYRSVAVITLQVSTQADTEGKSQLSKYFMRRTTADGGQVGAATYLQYYEQYSLYSSKKPKIADEQRLHQDMNGNWVHRRRVDDTIIARMPHFNPSRDNEAYSLRLLLTVVPAISLEDLKTVHGVKYATFKEAAINRGLVKEDDEYVLCIQIAAGEVQWKSLCSMFVTIILSGINASPLWTACQRYLIQDLTKPPHSYSSSQATDMVLSTVSSMLSENNKTCSIVGLPEPNQIQNQSDHKVHADVGSRLHDVYLTMTTEQRSVYDAIVNDAISGCGNMYFLDAPGGYGKSFVCNAILTKLESEGYTAIAVATSGIAAIGLLQGRTAHSMFNIPIDLTDGYECRISAKSDKADTMRRARLLLWDEISMAHKSSVESVDRLLKGLRQNSKSMGGVTTLLTGDFRQTAPVVRFGAEGDAIGSSVINSKLWKDVKRLCLTKPQRQKLDPEFADYLLRVGNGTEPEVCQGGLNGMIASLPRMKLASSISDLIIMVYGQVTDTVGMSRRAILATSNTCMEEINDAVLTRIQGDLHQLNSVNWVELEEGDKYRQYPPEALSGINVPGVPRGVLKLKIGAVIVFVRNCNFGTGIVNGQKGEVVAITLYRLSVRILGGKWDIVDVPRIDFDVQVGRRGITFKRRQFPVAVAYATTFHKSQGVTLDKVGIDLRNHPFAHGMLYVALSRVRRADDVCLLTTDKFRLNDTTVAIRNVTYSALVQAAESGKQPIEFRQPEGTTYEDDKFEEDDVLWDLDEWTESDREVTVGEDSDDEDDTEGADNRASKGIDEDVDLI